MSLKSVEIILSACSSHSQQSSHLQLCHLDSWVVELELYVRSTGSWRTLSCLRNGIQHMYLLALTLKGKEGCLYTPGVFAGSLSLIAAKRAICFHNNAYNSDAPCSFDNNPWMIMFGAIQLVWATHSSPLPLPSVFWVSKGACPCHQPACQADIDISLGTELDRSNRILWP